MTQDKKEEIIYLVRAGVKDWFPNVVIDDIKVQETPDTNTVTVLMNYRVLQTNIQDQLVINFEQ
jgi:hypothetical protein